MARYPSRNAALGVTLFSFVLDTLLTGEILLSASSLQWEEFAFEWEAADPDKSLSLRLLWYLLLAYFGSAAIVAGYGFVGVFKNRAPMVRLYRDCSITDLAFRLLLTVLCAYYAVQPRMRLALCEELSRHTELLVDLADTGLGADNCERWAERAAMAFVGGMALANVVKLHFILGVSTYYTHLYRHSPSHSRSHSHSRRASQQDYLQRVYLLPPSQSDNTNKDEVLVYAPVPLSALAPEVARDLKKTATEAYVPSFAPSHHHQHHQRHPSSPTRSRGYSHSHGYKTRTSASGRIALPLTPDDILLSPSSSSSRSQFETPKDS